MGLLLGKTGLEEEKQKEFLVQVVTPHIERVKRNFATTFPNISEHDTTTKEAMLANSIAAVAHLSKGFSKPARAVQTVLCETVHVTLSFLQVAPASEQVRNKTMVFLQRMIIVIEDRILAEMPQFLSILIEHCDADDILFVSQLFVQLSSKFKESSIPAIAEGLTPFLRKCLSIMPNLEHQSDHPPHFLTEQLAIKKLVFIVLQNVVSNGATPVLLSSSNLGNLEQVLQTMCDGATRIQDPTIQRTCLRFFRELVLQWLPSDFSRDYGSLHGQGLLIFILKSLIPNMIDCLLQKSFDEKDALSNRVILEFAHIIFNIRCNLGLVEGDHSLVLYHTIGDSIDQLESSSVSSQIAMDRFNAAESASELYTWLVEHVAAKKNRTTG